MYTDNKGNILTGIQLTSDTWKWRLDNDDSAVPVQTGERGYSKPIEISVIHHHCYPEKRGCGEPWGQLEMLTVNLTGLKIDVWIVCIKNCDIWDVNLQKWDPSDLSIKISGTTCTNEVALKLLVIADQSRFMSVPRWLTGSKMKSRLHWENVFWSTLTVPYCVDRFDIDLWIRVDAVLTLLLRGRYTDLFNTQTVPEKNLLGERLENWDNGATWSQLRTYIEKVKRYIASWQPNGTVMFHHLNYWVTDEKLHICTVSEDMLHRTS